jgi:FdhD protein
MPEQLRRVQRAFDRTGGLHAAGLFDRAGELCCAREDVGRHNAVDKVAGALVFGSVDAEVADLALAVSGRVSFEIVQKAARAGIGLIAAVSAPSSLAVEAATRLGVTLAAFVRGGTFNVYTHPERLDFGA